MLTYDLNDVKDSIIGRAFELAQEILKLPDGINRDHNQQCPVCEPPGYIGRGSPPFYTKGDRFYCRKCNQSPGWDIFSLIMTTEKVSFPQALTLVGDYAGCRMTNYIPKEKEDGYVPMDIVREWFNNFSCQETAELLTEVFLRGALVIGTKLWTNNRYEVYEQVLKYDRFMALSFDEVAILIKNSCGHPNGECSMGQAREILKRMVIVIRNQPGKKALRGEEVCYA